MDHPDRAGHASWVERELARLDPGDTVVDAGRHLARFRAGRRAAFRHQRYRWAAAVAAAMTLSLLSTPDTRGFATRCIDACVVATNRISRLVRASLPETGNATRTRPDLPRSSSPSSERVE